MGLMLSFGLIAIYLVIVLMPLILSWTLGWPSRPFRDEIAAGLGMAAFAMILAEFVLSGRFKRLSRGIGMDVTLRFHQVIARTALAFALLHPFFYSHAVSGGPRPWDPTRALTLTTDFSDLVSGIVAYLLLPSLVLLAIGRTQLDYKYETWRLMHGIGSLLIALLLLHHALYAGRYGAAPLIMWFWVAMTATAVAAMVNIYVIQPLRQRARPWRVSAVTRLTPHQWRVKIAPDGHRGLDYDAGQFAWLNIGHTPFTLFENPFSISSAPADGGELGFVIKELGDFTNSLSQVTPGMPAFIDGPYGNLTVRGRDAPGIALIAGGVGIAPMLGILRQMRLTHDRRPVKIIYGNRAQEQIIQSEDLSREDVTYVLSEPPDDWAGERGMVDAAVMDRVFSAEDYHAWLFILCGPPAMMDAIEDHLIARGTPSGNILSERFAYD